MDGNHIALSIYYLFFALALLGRRSRRTVKFVVWRFDIVEISTVAIPANHDAVIGHREKGKS